MKNVNCFLMSDNAVVQEIVMDKDKQTAIRRKKMTVSAWLILICVALLPVVIAWGLSQFNIADSTITIFTIIGVLVAVLGIQLYWARRNNLKDLDKKKDHLKNNQSSNK
ncbi:hypothetical protein [Catenovulum sediminis]|uniref:Uncharacterized protein n=1 Tax=Catenovulum sediminis TaxID=1740262 RepID=A0ABV1RJQ2_9ALTE|nr:hypothetical protein [Catenovulum sediminis]